MLQGVLIVGEAPGENEMREGKPFVGTSGKLLDSLLRKAGLARESFAVDNVVKCRPQVHSNEFPDWLTKQSAVQHCAENLNATIQRLQPKVILALGNTALERLTGLSGITRYRGYVLDGPFSTKVIPTFHPSYLLPRRGQKSTSHLTPAVVRDFQRALEIARADGFLRPQPTYLCDPHVGQAWAFHAEWRASGFAPLSIDIETPHKLTTADEEALDELDAQIIRVAYCFRPGYAMSIPWTPDYMHVHRAMLEEQSAHDKIWWNGWHFDIPVIQTTGMNPTGRHIDAMWAWHYLQPDLPRGLESVGSYYYDGLPWKHLGKEQPAKYNAIDADVALQNWIGIERGLRKHNQYDGFVEFTLELDPHLQEAGSNGVHIDRRARRRLYKVLRRVQKAHLAKVQPLVPKPLLPRKRYKKFPKVWDQKREIEPVKVRRMGKVCTACGSFPVTKGEHTARKGGKNGVPLNPCYKAEIELREIDDFEFDVVMDFNPLSADQLIAYCEYHGHPVGRNPKTGAPTVDDHHLEKLIGKYGEQFPLYEIVTELRGVGKALSTYVEGLKPNAEGVVLTQYSYAPASGRLSSKGLIRGSDRGVNLQNIPHRGDLDYAGDIRRMIVPRPGHVFVEADSSAIEAVFTGYYMGDEGYIRLAQMGVHAGFAAQSLGWEVTPENAAKVKKLAKTDKSVQILYERKKKTVHGVSYGMGERLLHMLYPQFFPSVASAAAEIDAFYEFVPKLKQWHHTTRVQAHKDTYLQLPLGNYRRYFHDVFSYVRDKQGNILLKDDGKTPKIKLGEDGKACIAQKPQGTAGMFMRRNAKNIAQDIKRRKLPFHLPGNYLVHDSYCLEVPDNPVLIDQAVELLAHHLTAPIPEMNGLRVGCEIKVGKDWDEMTTVRTVKV